MKKIGLSLRVCLFAFLVSFSLKASALEGIELSLASDINFLYITHPRNTDIMMGTITVSGANLTEPASLNALTLHLFARQVEYIDNARITLNSETVATPEGTGGAVTHTETTPFLFNKPIMIMPNETKQLQIWCTVTMKHQFETFAWGMFNSGFAQAKSLDTGLPVYIKIWDGVGMAVQIVPHLPKKS